MTIMGTIGAVLVVAGAFVATQNTSSRLPGPLMVLGVVMLLKALW